MPLSRREFLAVSGSALAAAAWPAGAAGPAPAGSGALRILVLGGTGFLGPELVAAARARGHSVTIFHRGKTRPELFGGRADVETLHGDRDGMLDALGGRSWDAVLDTSGYVPRLVKASAALLAPRVPLYVFVSSISVYDASRQPVDEGSQVQALADPATEDVRAHYGALKAACEQVAAQATGGRSLSIRPGLIVGPGDPTDRFTYWPVRLDRGGEVLCPGDGTDPVQVIDVRDLAAFLVLASEKKLTGTLNAVGPASTLTARAMVEACRPAGGKPVSTLTWVPAAFLEEQKVSAWSDLPAWIPAGSEEAGLARVVIAKALAAGLAFRPLLDTARDTLAWWTGLAAERRQKPRAGLGAEREAAVLASWKAARKG